MTKTISAGLLPALFLTLSAILCPVIVPLLFLPSVGHAGIFSKEKKHEEIAKRYGVAMVLITPSDKDGKALGAGNGFIVDPSGIVVTNYHCIKGATTAWVKLTNEAHYQVEGVLGIDRERDIAVLKAKAKNLPSAPIGDSDKLSWGERVVAISNSQGQENAISEGIISTLKGVGGTIQFTSRTSPGSSGGPVFNTKGQVVGIITSFAKEGQNLNLVVPINLVKPLLKGRLVALVEIAKEAEGEPDLRISELQEAVRLRPGDVEAHFNLGMEYNEEGQYDLAISEFQEAVRLGPDLAKAHLFLGMAYGGKGLNDLQISESQEALRLRPDFAEAHLSLGVAYSIKGQDDLAIREYQEAVRLKPDYAEAHHFLGATYNDKGQYDLAVNELQEAIRLQPEYTGAHYNLGVAYNGKGQHDLAINELQEALRIEPDYTEASELLDKLRQWRGGQVPSAGTPQPPTSTGKDTATEVKRHLEKGSSFLQEEKPDSAISEYQEAIRLRPDFAEAHLGLGAAYGMKGLHDLEIRQYEEALRLRPDFAEAHFALGSVYKEQGQHDLAIGQYGEAIKLKPDYAEAHRGLGVAYSTKGLYDLAIREFEETVKLKPDDAGAHYNLGIAYGIKGQYDLAERQFEETLRLRPDHEEARSILNELYKSKHERSGITPQSPIPMEEDKGAEAQLHLERGLALLKKVMPGYDVSALDPAISEFKEAVRLKPDLVEAHYNLGWAYGIKGQDDLKISEFEEAVRLRPNDAEAYRNLGAALNMSGRKVDAIVSYNKALAINPGYAKAWYEEGSILEDMDGYEEAITCCDKALAVNPKYTSAWSLKARCLDRLGRHQEAILCHERARNSFGR